MSAYPEEAPEVISFPDPRTRNSKPALSLRPSIDTILQQMNPSKPKTPGRIRMDDIGEPNELIDQEKAELQEQRRELARIQAESMERMRVAKELELLLEARESVLDKREAMLSTRMEESVPDQKISSLEKALCESHQALDQAHKSIDEMEETISGLRAEIEAIQAEGMEGQATNPSTDPYACVSDSSLQEQVELLREREAFIEQSENVLFDKAQHLQEWETRLQQMEHDGKPLAGEIDG